MNICLVSDDPLVASAVQASCPPPDRLEIFAMTGIVNPQNTLGDHGRKIAEAAAAFDVLLVSWDLARAPVINTLCYHVRRRVTTPVLALCRSGHEDQIAAIAAGADDALVFPVYPAVLQAKQLAYRRLVTAAREAFASQERPVPAQPDVVTFGALRLDRTAHRFSIQDEPVDLTPREFALLNFLIERRDTACTRDQILQHVWTLSFDTGTNLVDVYMHFLRRKLEAYGLKGMIQTVRGYGYRLIPPDASGEPRPET